MSLLRPPKGMRPEDRQVWFMGRAVGFAAVAVLAQFVMIFVRIFA